MADQTSVGPDSSLNPTFQASVKQAATTNPDAQSIEGVLLENVTGVNAEDPFWVYSAKIDTARWNQNFPYQLMILDADGSKNNFVTSFTLPIPPQELGISTPFAISTSATLGGIVEQHNGAPLRTITLSGTMGVWPGRKSMDVLPGLDVSQAVFGGTLMAVGNILGGVQSVLGTFTGQGGVEPNSSFAAAATLSAGFAVPGAETGYYQLRLLQQFLESYVTAKKSSVGQTLRLAFAIWKDQAVYLVTPVSFDIRRSAASPWEYMYSLQLRAWKRINYPESGISSMQTGYTASLLSLQGVSRLLRTVTAARQAFQLQNLVDVPLAALGDIHNIRTTIRGH